MTSSLRAGSADINSDSRALSRELRRVLRDENRHEILFGSNEHRVPDRTPLSKETGETLFELSERRSCRRVPLQRVVHVTPVVLENGTLCVPVTAKSSFLAYTSDLSMRGLGFTHDEPLMTRHAVITFDLIHQESVSLLIEITWTRCLADRSYRSGGKFVAITRAPEYLV
jgi:hypothetical protein